MNKADTENVLKRVTKNSPLRWKKMGFTKIPNSIFSDDRLNKNGLLVYIVLCMHQFQGKRNCFPSLATLSKETRLCCHSVIEGIEQLEVIGYISKEKNPGRSNIYTVLRITQNLIKLDI
ncbi:MAG: helix-turn-helix domain-containing protein [Candidatus Paceibacterota bacterium]|jgi:hypothetical protein